MITDHVYERALYTNTQCRCGHEANEHAVVTPNDVAIPQPSPIITTPSEEVIPRVVNRVRDHALAAGWAPATAEAVCVDIQARSDFGLAKYGTRLYTHNGRDALMDVYQEILDALNYACQHHIEAVEARDPAAPRTRTAAAGAWHLFYRVLNLAYDVKEALIARVADAD